MRTWSEMTEVQPLAGRIITNSIKRDRISHAYLIQGERGAGKEAIATLIAKGFLSCSPLSLNQVCMGNAAFFYTICNDSTCQWLYLSHFRPCFHYVLLLWKS